MPRTARWGRPTKWGRSLTEAMLLGNLAVWSGEKVEWDAAEMKSKNVKGPEGIIKPNYRKGYTLDV